MILMYVASVVSYTLDAGRWSRPIEVPLSNSHRSVLQLQESRRICWLVFQAIHVHRLYHTCNLLRAQTLAVCRPRFLLVRVSEWVVSDHFRKLICNEWHHSDFRLQRERWMLNSRHPSPIDLQPVSFLSLLTHRIYSVLPSYVDVTTWWNDSDSRKALSTATINIDVSFMCSCRLTISILWRAIYFRLKNIRPTVKNPPAHGNKHVPFIFVMPYLVVDTCSFWSYK